MQRSRRVGFGLSVWCCVLLTAGLPGVWGAPVTVVLNSSDPANRVDLAILGDGYTAAKMSQNTTYVQQLLQALFTQEPCREYQGYFNVHRVDVVNADSGPNHPEWDPPAFKNTALGATYHCARAHRIWTVEIIGWLPQP